MPPRLSGPQRRAKQARIRESRNNSSASSSARGTGPTGEVSNVNEVKTNNNTIAQEKKQKSGGVKNSGPAISLRYPNNRIESSTDYLEIKIVEYTPNSKLNSSIKGGQAQTKKEGKVDGGGLSSSQESTVMGALKSGSRMETATSRARKAKPLAYINLPIPQNVADTNSINWDSDTLNPLKALGANLAMTGMTNPGALLSGMKNLKGFGEIDDNLKNAILAKLAGSAVGVDSLMTRATGQVLNPNMEVLFKGPNIRSFPFQFTFAPRSMSEAQQVKQIIRTIKKHSAPKGDSGNGFFIKSPDVFILTYKKGGGPHPFLNVFKPMALESIGMNYTAGNTYSTFHDGTPTIMQMTLQMQELNPVYSEHYDEGEGLQGVGY
jgi:hypothetical protein